jgi:hypothetical protein
MVAMVGVTDRGALWRASRQRPNDRIVRVVEPRFADGAFRQAVSALGQRQHAGMLEITSHDWTPDGRYYVEYATGTTWRTLAERLADLTGWQDRVALLERVCSLFPRWRRSPVHPIGLSPHNVVVVAEDDHWLPWLVPCPSVTLSSPCDLFGVDTVAIAALAPEVVRGVQLDDRAVDVYALGTLVAQALGDTDLAAILDDADRVEAQARGMLLPPMTTSTRIPSTLSEVPAGQDMFRAVEHYRQTAPSARPPDADELRSILARVADPVAAARTLRRTDPVRALDVLQWVREDDVGARLDACLLAADITTEHGDHEAVLRHLGDAVALAPGRSDLRHRRYEAAWQVFESLPAGGRRDPVGQTILDDIAWLRPMASDDDTTLFLRAAEIHLSSGDPGAALTELYGALVRDPGDLAALWQYCRCWIELGDPAKAGQTATEARRRIDRMFDAQLLTAGEAQLWRERFAELLS